MTTPRLKKIPENFFCLMLHSHIPYVKKAGVWPFGEEWLLEGILETYIPLVRDLIYGVIIPARKIGKNIAINLGITPVLADQLSSDYFKTRFVEFARDKIRRAETDIERFSRSRQSGLESLARRYRDIFAGRLEYFEKIKGDLVKEIRQAAEAGAVEIITSSATHSYLPLLGRDSSVYAQIKTGIDVHTSLFGMKPSGFWLPECAYRPAYYLEDKNGRKILRKGLDEYLAIEGIKYFFVDTHAVEGGLPPESYTAVADGKNVQGINPLNGNSSLKAYRARNSGVLALARHRQTGMLVWSADVGYPGDGDYREFHKKDGVSGLQYWKVTSKNVDLGGKEIYSVERAMKKVSEHARHFRSVIYDTFRLASHRGVEPPRGIFAPYDAELYGHWWGEGIDWLTVLFSSMIDDVKESAAGSSGMEADFVPSTVGQYVESVRKAAVIDIPESSWGSGGGHYIWLNKDTRWMWNLINECENIMEEAADLYYRRPDGKSVPGLSSVSEKLRARIISQMAREKFLLESSDWEFLVTTAQAGQYAQKRFLAHYNRFKKLWEMFFPGNNNRNGRNGSADKHHHNGNGSNAIRFSDDEIRFLEAVSAIDSLFERKIEPRYFLTYK